VKAALEFIIRNIVKDPSGIEIAEEGSGSTKFIIKAEGSDIGTIIGKQGKIIKAIREVLRIKAIKQNKYFELEVKEK